ncbi:MAG TPA: ankyrin repeat domain-containing protein [Pyrinomonadaceae bacterium]|jgi:flagellar hook assembly protein FlgD
MPKRVSSLDDISVSSPCSVEWDSMAGNDRVRFCGHCQRSVHNLSEMTQKDALRLVAKSKGRLCVRYYSAPDRSIQTASLPQQLHQITRRTSRIAAGAFTAALSLSMNVVARTPSSSDEPLPAGYQLAAGERKFVRDVQTGSASLTGTILDPNGAVIPGAKIKLINEGTQLEQETASDDNGAYRFDSLEPGNYTLKVESPGFSGLENKGIILQSGEVSHVDTILQVSATVIATMGIVAVATPSEPLVKAAYENDLASVKKLLASGVDPDVLDKSIDSTALAQAAAHDNREMMLVLLHAGAEVNRQNRNGETALMFLSEGVSAETVRALIKAGADLEVKDDDGETALIMAARLDNTDVLKALISAGAKIEAKDEKGQTALMAAAREGLIDNVKALLEAGAQINVRDEEEWTALRHAREDDEKEVMKLLRDRGAIE